VHSQPPLRFRLDAELLFFAKRVRTYANVERLPSPVQLFVGSGKRTNNFNCCPASCDILDLGFIQWSSVQRTFVHFTRCRGINCYMSNYFSFFHNFINESSAKNFYVAGGFGIFFVLRYSRKRTARTTNAMMIYSSVCPGSTAELHASILA